MTIAAVLLFGVALLIVTRGNVGGVFGLLVILGIIGHACGLDK